VRAEEARAEITRCPFTSFENIVDLTHTLTPHFPYIPVPGITFPFNTIAIATIEQHGVAANRWEIHEHIGTQIDAPSHFIAGGSRWTKYQSRTLLRRSRSSTFGNGLATTPTRSPRLTTSRHGKSGTDACHKVPPSSCTQAGTRDPKAFIIWMARARWHFLGFAAATAAFLVRSAKSSGLAWIPSHSTPDRTKNTTRTRCGWPRTSHLTELPSGDPNGYLERQDYRPRQSDDAHARGRAICHVA